MPFPPSVISHGPTGERMRADVLRLRSQQIHEIEQQWCMDSANAYALGEAPPGFADMRIVEIEPLDAYEGSSHALRLRAEGIADGSAFIELGREDSLAQEGWDQTSLSIYTADPKNARWVKGAQLQIDPITVAAEADDGIFTVVAHGFAAGQLGILEFASGFGGAVSGTKYLIQPVDADSFRLADPVQTKSISGIHSTNLITSNAHGLANNTAVILPVLKGGTGLSTFTIYFVRDSATNTLKLAATPGGAAIDFTADITGYSTLLPLLTLSSDGIGGILRPIEKGMELMWITDINCTKSRAKNYYELQLMLKGVNYAAGTGKAVTRRISATAQALSFDNFNPVLFTGHPVYYGDSDDDLQQIGTHDYALGGHVDFDLPQASVSLTYISPNPPPTWMLGTGMRWIPKDAPAVSAIGLYSDTETIYFPNGWRLMNVHSEQLPGQSLYLTTVAIGHQRATTPNV